MTSRNCSCCTKSQNADHIYRHGKLTLSSHLLFGWKTLDQGNGPVVTPLMVVPRWNVVADEKRKKEGTGINDSMGPVDRGDWKRMRL